MNFDIVFDFSSSGSGGSLKRIQAYIDFFKKAEFKVIFLINKKALVSLNGLESVDYLVIEKSILSKLLCNQSHLNFIKEKPKCYFSYGFPISKKVGLMNWFHISNALPLNINIKYLDLFTFFKMIIVRFQYKFFCKTPDVVSGESRYTLKAYSDKIDPNIKTVLLENGSSYNLNLKNNQSDSFRYALVVGTESYKRLFLAYKVFMSIKKTYKLKKIIIVGKLSWINCILKLNKNIITFNNPTKEEYISLISNSTFFISSSYVENSSNAALDGILFARYTILSDIPSHNEMLAAHKTKKILINKYRFILFKKSKNFKSPKWSISIRKMIGEINLI